MPGEEQRALIDKTAEFVSQSQNSEAFEQKVAKARGDDPRFGFLRPGGAFHAYYRRTLLALRGISEGDAAAAASAKESVSAAARGASERTRLRLERAQAEDHAGPRRFRPMPSDLPPADAAVMKRAALVVALRGEAAEEHLVRRDGGAGRLGFLQKTHPMHAVFRHLVEAYGRLRDMREVPDHLGDDDAFVAAAVARRNVVRARAALGGGGEGAHEAEDDAWARGYDADAIRWDDFDVVGQVLVRAAEGGGRTLRFQALARDGAEEARGVDDALRILNAIAEKVRRGEITGAGGQEGGTAAGEAAPMEADGDRHGAEPPVEAAGEGRHGEGEAASKPPTWKQAVDYVYEGGEIIRLEVEANAQMPVAEVKAQLERSTGLAPKKMKVTLPDGTILFDRKVIRDYPMIGNRQVGDEGEEVVLKLVKKVRGGKK